MNKETEGYIRLEISDTGCGINDQGLKQLFEKFKQVEVDSSKRQIGTGIGSLDHKRDHRSYGREG